MSVRLKYAGDKNISGSARESGCSLFSVPAAGGGCPAIGTVLSVMNDVEYPVEYGGSTVGCLNPNTLYYTYVPNQTCDVNVVADGVCGSSPNWAGVYDVKYKPYGAVATAFSELPNYIEISGNCTSTNQYPNGTKTDTCYHDGSGNVYSATTSWSYASYGYTFFYEECTDENGNPATYFYYSDQNGGYFT